MSLPAAEQLSLYELTKLFIYSTSFEGANYLSNWESEAAYCV